MRNYMDENGNVMELFDWEHPASGWTELPIGMNVTTGLGERRIFHIDIGKMSPEEGKRMLENMGAKLKQTSLEGRLAAAEAMAYEEAPTDGDPEDSEAADCKEDCGCDPCDCDPCDCGDPVPNCSSSWSAWTEDDRPITDNDIMYEFIHADEADAARILARYKMWKQEEFKLKLADVKLQMVLANPELYAMCGTELK